jgi:hypothetical protein
MMSIYAQLEDKRDLEEKESLDMKELGYETVLGYKSVLEDEIKALSKKCNRGDLQKMSLKKRLNLKLECSPKYRCWRSP